MEQVPVTMVTYGPGDPLPRAVLDDWLEFVGVAPARLIFATTDEEAASPSVAALRAQVPFAEVLEIQRCGRGLTTVEGEALVNAAERATTPWLLFFKLDTLPYATEDRGWLGRALAEIARGGYTGFTGSSRWPDLADAGDGWRKTQRFSLNFGLLPRAFFLDVMKNDCAEQLAMVSSGELSKHERFFIERSIEARLRATGGWNLYRPETPGWTVFHVNAWGDELARIRERYRRRVGIEPFLNDGAPRAQEAWRSPRWERYYGAPRPGLARRLRLWAGRVRRRGRSTDRPGRDA